ncbi:MAG: hypothetical protein NVSMB32_13820 [Actinomycetota bacterium]
MADPIRAAATQAILFPTYDRGALEELAAFGTRRSVAGGDLLFVPGDDPPDFFVVLAGEVISAAVGGGSSAVGAVREYLGTHG